MSQISQLVAERDEARAKYETLSAAYDEASKRLEEAGYKECPPDDTVALDVAVRIGHLVDYLNRVEADLAAVRQYLTDNPNSLGAKLERVKAEAAAMRAVHCNCATGPEHHAVGAHESCEYYKHHCASCHEKQLCTAEGCEGFALWQRGRDLAERVALMERLLAQSKQVFDTSHDHDKGVACATCAMSEAIGEVLENEGATNE